VAVQIPDGQDGIRKLISKALVQLAAEKDKLIVVVEDIRQAEWLSRLEDGKPHLIEASGNRASFTLAVPDNPKLSEVIRGNLERVFRARNLIALSQRFEEQRYRDTASVDVDVEVLRHEDKKSPGEVWPMPAGGWIFRPGDLISFRLKNKSKSLTVDVTLLIVASDFEIQPFYPKKGELAKSLKPGDSIDTPLPPGEISNEPPFGPECLIVIAVPPSNHPVDFSALAQDGLIKARAADKSRSLESPLGELLESSMFRTGTRGLSRSVTEQHGMRIVTWRTEAAKPKAP
jgi:hypothetical protein